MSVFVYNNTVVDKVTPEIKKFYPVLKEYTELSKQQPNLVGAVIVIDETGLDPESFNQVVPEMVSRIGPHTPVVWAFVADRLHYFHRCPEIPKENIRFPNPQLVVKILRNRLQEVYQQLGFVQMMQFIDPMKWLSPDVWTTNSPSYLVNGPVSMNPCFQYAKQYEGWLRFHAHPLEIADRLFRPWFTKSGFGGHGELAWVDKRVWNVQMPNQTVPDMWNLDISKGPARESVLIQRLAESKHSGVTTLLVAFPLLGKRVHFCSLSHDKLDTSLVVNKSRLLQSLKESEATMWDLYQAYFAVTAAREPTSFFDPVTDGPVLTAWACYLSGIDVPGVA